MIKDINLSKLIIDDGIQLDSILGHGGTPHYEDPPWEVIYVSYFLKQERIKVGFFSVTNFRFLPNVNELNPEFHNYDISRKGEGYFVSWNIGGHLIEIETNEIMGIMEIGSQDDYREELKEYLK